MEVSINLPDDVAQSISAGGDVSRQILEAFAADAYRNDVLTLLQVSQLLGLTRVETEDLMGRHQVPLSEITEADLDREAALFEEVARRRRPYTSAA